MSYERMLETEKKLMAEIEKLLRRAQALGHEAQDLQLTVGEQFGSPGGWPLRLWLGYIMVKAMQAAAFDFPYVFPWLGVVVAVAVGILFGVVAAFIPARQAAKLDVVRALQYE